MRLTLFTPTYAPDFERFCLQRESIERCGIDIPHVAAVNDEDVEHFRKNVPHQKNLTILSTRDLLGQDLERRRKVWQISRRDYRYWITGKGVHGWAFQQLLKLAAPQVIHTRGILCLDSDTFFVGRVAESDFFSEDGRLHLYETEDDLDAEMAEWYAHSLRFFDLKPAHEPVRRYTHSPVPMDREVVGDMTQWIARRYGCAWTEAILNADRVMEYTTYGTYARHIDKLRRTSPARPALTLYYWWSEQAKALAEDFQARLEESRARMVLINSNTQTPVGLARELCLGVWPRSSELAYGGAKA